MLACGLVVLTGCSTVPDPGDGIFNDRMEASPATVAQAGAIDYAKQLYAEGLYEQARVEVDRQLAAGVTHPEGYLLKARLLVQAGDADGAVPWCDRALAGSSAWIEPRILLAQIHLDRQRYAAASAVFADIDRLAPYSPWGPYGRAVVSARRGDAAAAMPFLAQAIDRDPDHVASRALQAQLARLAGDAQREEAALVRLAQLLPDDATVRVRLGELALAAGRPRDARRLWRQAYELEPRPTTAAKLSDLDRLEQPVQAVPNQGADVR